MIGLNKILLRMGIVLCIIILLFLLISLVPCPPEGCPTAVNVTQMMPGWLNG